MSLPVTRRIARAALLVAAGAAPVIAAAGTASAANLPVKAPDLVGGLTAPLDSHKTGDTLDRAAHQGVGVLNEAGNKAATKLAPALVETAGPVVKKAMPVTRGATDKAEKVVRPVAKDGLSTDSLPLKAAGGLLGAPDALAGKATGLLGAPDALAGKATGLLGGLPVGGKA
ncbi:ATP-binding protein [Streptomyces sp. N2A]|uniref:ATP-binding protein n=1 Tax=Streptomyces sp. N2A TaxID=3073936 RepID=UPI0028706CF2|nr:ATP-binding protein [Streptomyces sp. N2A]